jgi:hypothetical protein
MKSKVMFIGLVMLTTSLFTSCKKCYQCDAIDTTNNQVYYSESNLCGDDEVRSFERDFNDPSIDSKARCTRE